MDDDHLLTPKDHSVPRPWLRPFGSHLNDWTASKLRKAFQHDIDQSGLPGDVRRTPPGMKLRKAPRRTPFELNAPKSISTKELEPSHRLPGVQGISNAQTTPEGIAKEKGMLMNPAKLINNDCHWTGDPKIVSSAKQAISEPRWT